jgi:hypothetical protein
VTPRSWLLLGAAAALVTAGGLYVLTQVSQTDYAPWWRNVPPPRLWRRSWRLYLLKRDLEAHGGRFESGYRSRHVNALIPGAASNSKHLEALALDVVPATSADKERLNRRVRELRFDRGALTQALHHDAGTGAHWHLQLA